MAQDFIALASEILATQYTEAMRNAVNIEPSFICQKIAENNKGYDGSEVIEGTAAIGLSGGVGFGNGTGYGTPEAANIMRKKFRVAPKEYFVSINLLDRLVRTKKSESALVDYVNDEIEGAYQAAKWNMGRALYGNGSGILAITSAAQGKNIIDVAGARNLIEGILVDIYAEGAKPGTAPLYSKVRILAIEGKRNRVSQVLLDTKVTLDYNSFITLQNSYGNEITGIGAIFDDDITEIGGVNKSENPWVKPIVKDAEHDITNNLIRQALRESDDKNGQIDAIAMGAGAYDAYATYLEAQNIRLESSSNDILGGFNTMKFKYGNRLIDIYEEKFIEDGDVIGISTQDIEPHMTELDYATAAPDSSKFQLLDGTSIYQAMMMSYGNYIYRNPGAFFKITNANAAE
jgi:hypothetical protein